MDTKLTRRVMRLTYEASEALKLAQDDWELLILDYEDPQRFEFVTVIQSSNFKVHKSDGQKANMNFNKLKTRLRVAFEEIYVCILW